MGPALRGGARIRQRPAPAAGGGRVTAPPCQSLHCESEQAGGRASGNVVGSVVSDVGDVRLG